MAFVLQPWHLLVAGVAGWVNRQQQLKIEYLETQINVLQEEHGNRRLILTDDQRRRLAVKAHALGRQGLKEIHTLFTPDTLLRWHRRLVAKKWDYSDRRSKPMGRPALDAEVEQLIVRLAKENPTQGYDRIAGARSIKDECLDRMIFFGANSLRNAVREHLALYHAERNYQGLENQLIDPGNEVGQTTGEIECRERLGGMLKYYHRAA